MAIGTAAAIIGAGALAAGAGAYSANKASKAQGKAADQASATQLEMFYENQAAQQPWTDAGEAGLNRLSVLLGLDPEQSGAAPKLESADEIRARLAPTYRSLKLAPQDYTNKLNVAVRAEMEKQKQEQAAYRRNPVTKDPLFGSLLTPFTGKDLKNEPGYQFGMQQGQQGLDNQFSRAGGLLSGAALKAASRFNQDYAGTKFNDAFNRDQANKSNTFNRLASLSGVGQQAVAQVGNQGMQTAQIVGNNTMQAGNARASGYVGTANALNNGISQGMNWWQGNQLLNSLNQQPTYGVAQQPGVTGWVSQG